MTDISLLGYSDHLNNYKAVAKIVSTRLKAAIRESKINTMQIACRIKTQESVTEKWQRKPEHYSSIFDMTDIVGFRVICYFSDNVDMIGDIVKSLFDVDEKNSVDKRNIIAANTFGYMSLHYVCTLPKSSEYSDDLTKYSFEIQIRTVLQHTWAEIEHDLGYKTEFGVPRQVRREFSRISSLLEIADEGFLRIKEQLNDYTTSVVEKLSSGDVADVAVDNISLREFIKYNETFVNFTDDIASISGAVLINVNVEPYIKQLEFLGVSNLMDILRLLDEEKEHAMILARSILTDSEIEELASTVGLYFLCRARLIWGGYSEDDIKKFFETSNTDSRKVERNVSRILTQRRKYIGA